MRPLFAATVMILVNLLGHDGAVAQDIVPPIYVVSYIEVAPHSVPEARQLILSYSADARKAPGAADTLVQASRRNHMTLVESWSSFADKEVEISTSATKSFRQALQPMSGSLYDERAYKLLR